MPDTEWTSPRRMMVYYMDQQRIGDSKTAPILTTFAHMREFHTFQRIRIYPLRSSLRHTSCWVSAITGGTGLKITGPRHF